MLMDYDVMLSDYLCIDRCYWQVLLSVQNIEILGMLMASMDLLGLWIESGSGLYMVWVFFLLHMWHMTGYIMMLFMNHWHVSLMDASWRLLANRTHIWSKGVMQDNQRYWGRGVATTLPQPTSTPTVARIVVWQLPSLRDPWCREGGLRQSLTKILRGGQ